MNTLRVSIVITAWNEAHAIGGCLAALAAQQGIDRQAREIIVVDDRGDDGTGDVVAASGLAGLRPIRNDALPPQGVMTARQHALDIGFRAARAPIIVTLDADAVVPPDFVVRLIEPIEAERADMVAGAVAFSDGPIGALQSVDAAYYLAVCRLLNRLSLDGGVLFGACAFRAAIYRAAGGFARIGMTLTEDLAFSRAARKAGARLAYLPRPVATVRAATSLSALVTRAKRISAAPMGPLAYALGGWMALLVLAAIGAIVFGGGFWMTALALRYLAGAMFAARAVATVSGLRHVPLALIYEPLATAIGLGVAVTLLRGRRVDWGGMAYDR